MLTEKNNKWYECLKDFSHLNGREKQQIAVADSADARTGRFLFLYRIKHNWPSQWRTRYNRGYIEFLKITRNLISKTKQSVARRFFSSLSLRKYTIYTRGRPLRGTLPIQ